MRIGWVIYGALDQATGGYIYDRLVIDHLRACGDMVRVIELDPEPRSRIASAVGLVARAPGLDVIVGDELCHRELLLAFPALRMRVGRALLIHHLRAWEMPRGPRRRLVSLAEIGAIGSSDVLLATSFTTSERLRIEHGVRGVEVAVPGADRLDVRPRRVSSAIRLVFVGSLIPRKRVLELLLALERARDPRLELSLIGDDARDRSYAARVREAVRTSPFLRERVRFRGRLSDGALADALAEAGALVLPSSLEGYGMVLTEAVRAGVPVIAARVGAVGEVVRDGAEALLFDSEPELVDALRRFANDAELRAKMQAAAEARAPSLPTWRATGEAVRSALSRAALLGRRRSP